MNTIIGVIGLPNKGKSVSINLQPIETFQLNLDVTKDWYLGIDQSSSCTGICLLSTDLTYVILLDVRRDKNLPKEVFYGELCQLLRRISLNVHFKIIANERPVPSKYRNAGAVLLELKGKLDEWIYTIPAFRDVEHVSLYPQTWKSLVVNKNKGKGRTRDKAAIAEDIVDQFPVLLTYYNMYPYSDYDSFDATGIIYGYLQYAFDENGNRMICGDRERTHVSFVCYQWVPVDDVNAKFIKDSFRVYYKLFMPKYLTYNSRYSMLENVRMASTNHDAVVTIVPRDQLQPFQWKFGIDITDTSHVLLMYVFRKGAFSAGSIDTLKYLFEMNEEVTDEPV